MNYFDFDLKFCKLLNDSNSTVQILKGIAVEDFKSELCPDQKKKLVQYASFSSGAGDRSVFFWPRRSQSRWLRGNSVFGRQGRFAIETELVLPAPSSEFSTGRNSHQSTRGPHFSLTDRFRYSRPQRRLHLYGPQSGRNIQFHGYVERQRYWTHTPPGNQTTLPWNSPSYSWDPVFFIHYSAFRKPRNLINS